MGLVWHGAVRWHCACAWEGAWQKPTHLASPVACVWSPIPIRFPDFRGRGGRGGGGHPPASAECSGLGVRRARGFLGAALWHRGPLKVWPSILACRGLLRDQCVVRSGAVPCTNHSIFPHRCRRHSSAGKAAPRECLECVCVQHLVATRLPCIQAEGFHESILACKERTACHQRGLCGALPSP